MGRLPPSLLRRQDADPEHRPRGQASPPVCAFFCPVLRKPEAYSPGTGRQPCPLAGRERLGLSLQDWQPEEGDRTDIPQDGPQPLQESSPIALQAVPEFCKKEEPVLAMEEGCVYSDDTQLSPVALPCAGKKDRPTD